MSRIPKGVIRGGPSASWGTALVALAAAALAAYVHRGALAAFYTTDDLILFERARGIAAYPATLWRVIPGRLWFQSLLPAFDMNPAPWHAASLALHAAATALVVVWARRMGATRTAAFLAAVIFGTAARARTAVWPVSGAGELLSTVLMLVVLLALLEEGRHARRGGIVAAVAQALAMFCKETVALAPLVVWLAPAPGTPANARRIPWVPLALGAAMWAYVGLTRGSTGSLSGDAYAFGIGLHVLDHLFTDVLWSCDLLHVFGGITSPLAPPQAAAAAVVLVLAAFAAWKSGSRAARAGLWLWLLLLLPVLGLRNAVYDHYVYAPRIGWALMLAALLDSAVRGAAGWPAWRARAATGAALVVALLHVGTALLFFAAAEGARIEGVGLPRDGFMRRLEVARNAAMTLERQLTPQTRRIVIYEAPGSGLLISVREGAVTRDTSATAVRQMLLDAVLDEGRALRALFPQLESVTLARHVEPGDRDAALFIANADCRLLACGTGAEGHLQVVRLWAGSNMTAAARTHLAEAAVLYPGLESRAAEAGLGR